jgi:hypothetical protein
MDYITGAIGAVTGPSDPNAKVTAAQQKVADLEKQLGTAKEELATAQREAQPPSGTVDTGGVKGGKRRKTRRRKGKSRRSRT